jgi:pectinesterase
MKINLLLLALLLLFLHQCDSIKSLIPQKVIVVARDGSGQFTNIQDAVNSIPDYNRDWIEIYIKPGVYFGHISIPALKTFIKLSSSDPSGTIITYNNTCQVNYHIDPIDYVESATVTLYNDDFYAENITIENSHGPGIQAIALATLASRQQFHNCIISGYQDTLFACFGLQFFQNNTIIGAVDFIYGGANAIFSQCNIQSIGSGAVTAPNTDRELPFGLTFLNCTLTALPSVAAGSVYLGRTWGPYARADFLYSFEGGHISPLGWNNMGYPVYESTVHVSEYDNYGPGSATQKRVNWSSQLTSSQAANYTLTTIFGSWNPFSQ